MHISYLRKVGGSVMLSVPPAILDVLQLKAGAPVGFSVDENRLIIEPQPRSSYTLDELLSQCDATQPISPEDREWLDVGRIGSEQQ
jgi:antitoxin ChpS